MSPRWKEVQVSKGTVNSMLIYFLISKEFSIMNLLFLNNQLSILPSSSS